jgi:pre-mRNA-processing factor 17
MHAPALGPANPRDRGSLAADMRNHWSGHAENAHVSGYAFDEQFHTFHSSSQKSKKDVGDEDKSKASSRKKQKVDTSDKKATEDGSSLPYYALQSRQPWAGKEVAVAELTEEQRAMIERTKAEKSEKAAQGSKSNTTDNNQTIFHGQEEKDYQGRSWLEPSPTAAALTESDSCFLPKRHIHTWSGHTKGVNALRFFPKTGHLLLSAGLDGKAKVWDVTGDKRCMRTYLGHSKGIRDTWFFPDGRQFATAAYDKVIKLWDTETGAVVGSFGQGQMAYTVRCHPDPSEPNVLMAGMQNKKILQFDVRTGDVVQEYDYHLAAVNSLTFIDENRRFISTSDDKSIRVWEFGIPVQVKYIADPSMHAISTAAVTPNGKWWLGQCADNQIVTYSANDRVKQNRKKVFKGHVGAGYACQVGVSHDERYVISGDGEGKLFIWDWKSTKIVRSLKAHEGGPCVGAEWHPLETSKVATCGWDGLIKYWD